MYWDLPAENISVHMLDAIQKEIKRRERDEKRGQRDLTKKRFFLHDNKCFMLKSRR